MCQEEKYAGFLVLCSENAYMKLKLLPEIGNLWIVTLIENIEKM